MNPLPTLDPAHDGRHALRDGPLERESMPYIIALPELGLALGVYTWVNKDSLAGAALFAFGPAMGATPVVEVVDGISVSPEMDFGDWTVGGVTIRHDLKFRTAQVQVRHARLQFDAQFEALHAPYAYSFHARGCPAFAATDRIEQSGRIHGSFAIDGKSQTFETTGARDHSWGTRDWAMPQHWKWLHAQAGETAAHFWQIALAGRVELRGYLLRDGSLSEIESVEVDWQGDEHFRQTHLEARLRDRLGRTAVAVLDYFAHFDFPAAANCMLVEGAARCTIDGVAGAAWTEFMWPIDYREHLKANRAIAIA